MAKDLQVVAQAFVALSLGLAFAAEAGGSPPGQPPQSAAVVIGEVELQGVTVLTQKEIEALLDVGPGEKLERLKVFRTAENLKKAYAQRGYELMTIQSRVYRKAAAGRENPTTLEFTISEGSPTRIARVTFSPGELKTPAARREWDSKVGQLGSKFGLRAGDPNDRDKISAGQRALAEVLTSEEYIGAKVQDIRVTEVQPPEGLKPLPAARWVALEVLMDVGERVTFGFRGNKAVNTPSLLGLVDSQRLLGLGKTYVTDIQARILDVYRSIGYGLAQITPLTFELSNDRGRHVTYMIQEGPRVQLDSVVFDGNGVFGEPQLRAQFRSRAPFSVQNGYFVESDIERAANLLVEWIQSQGYLAAKLVAVHSNYLPERPEHKDRARVRAVVYLYEGDRTTIDKVDIEGNTALAREKILETLGVAPGAPLNLFAFTEGLEALKSAYREQGYHAMRILDEATSKIVLYGNENRTATIDLKIEEGPQYRMTQLAIEGNSLTHAEVIRREIELKEGDILAESRLRGIETRLRKLGIFSGVLLKLSDDPSDPAGKVLRVSVQEAEPGAYQVGAGFRNDLGFRGFGSVTYSNIGGRNHALSLTANGNWRWTKVNEQMIKDVTGGIPPEGSAQLAYVWPWTFWGDLTTRPTFTVSSTQYRTFNAAKASAAVSFEKKLSKSAGLTAYLTGSWDYVSQTSAASPLDEQDLTIMSVTPSVEFDLRDNPLAPTRGFFAEGSLEFAAPFMGSSAFIRAQDFTGNRTPPVGYYRVQLRGDYHLPLPLGLSLYLSFRTGFERNNEPGGSIPLIKQFTLGGAGSLRGFAPQEINVAAASVTGTASFVNYRSQLDLPLSGPMKFGPFLDVGNLLLDSFPGESRYYIQDLYVGAGLGIHYQTPIGPVNFDMGFKLRGPPGSDPFRLDFSIGVI